MVLYFKSNLEFCWQFVWVLDWYIHNPPTGRRSLFSKCVPEEQNPHRFYIVTIVFGRSLIGRSVSPNGQTASECPFPCPIRTWINANLAGFVSGALVDGFQGAVFGGIDLS